MIRHCVFLHFKAEISTEQRNALFEEIAVLQNRLPGILQVHIGQNVSPETGMDKGYSDGFMVDFSDANARDVYLEDADHQRTGAKLVEAAQGGVDGILVYDLEVGSH
jgi:hypothetical protein